MSLTYEDKDEILGMIEEAIRDYHVPHVVEKQVDLSRPGEEELEYAREGEVGDELKQGARMYPGGYEDE